MALNLEMSVFVRVHAKFSHRFRTKKHLNVLHVGNNWNSVLYIYPNCFKYETELIKKAFSLFSDRSKRLRYSTKHLLLYN